MEGSNVFSWKDPRNYKLISLASIPRKVMEQITAEAVLKHIKDKKVTGSTQHGFMKMKSCLTNLMAFYDEITRLVDKQRAVDTVYVAFRAGFDTISPNNPH